MRGSRFITTGQAARELGISSATLTRWAAKGIVNPAERTAGGHFRWHLAALRRQVAVSRDPEASTLAEDIASVVHDANRRWQIVTGDPAPSPLWEDAPDRQAEGAIATVRAALEDLEMTARQAHERWFDAMTADGWVSGRVKDEQARTHPDLVHWDMLPDAEQRKSMLLIAITRALQP
jgi:RyR domain/MerR family regulatory protein